MPRIAVVTPVFPNSNDPYRGIFNYHRVRALQKWADVEVNVLLPAYPRAKIFQPVTRSYPRIDPSYTVPGVKVRYIEYQVLPVISRPFNSSTCARRMLPYIMKEREKDRPDLILAYWVYPEGMGAVMVGKKLGIPVIVQAVGTDLRVIPDSFTRLGVKRTLRRAGL